MWPFPTEEQVKTRLKIEQIKQADQTVQGWGMKKVKEVSAIASIPVNNTSPEEVSYAMHKAFEEEKRAMRQAFTEEVSALNASNQEAMAAILNGLNQLQEGTKAATSEIEKKFAAEFAKEMARHMSTGPTEPNSKGKPRRFDNFRDMGNYVDVENKR